MSGHPRGLTGGVFAAALLALLPAARAQTDASMDMGTMQGGDAPAGARDPHAYAGAVDFTRGAERPVLMDHHRFRSLRLDRFEIADVDGKTVVPFDVEAWIGKTYDRVALKSEGAFEGGDLGHARTEALWAHAIAPFWDSGLGVRHDSGTGPGRTWLAAGIEGLAPYRFDVELTAYVGEASRTALRFDVSYEMLMTQRLILEPRLEANFYGKDDVERGLGTGLSDAALGLRLRYEIRRELAPYVGVEWVDEYGGTEELTRAAGVDPSDARFVLGIRFWL